MGPNKLADDLRAELAAGGVLVVAGAGVAMQATDKEPCAGWVGLLEHGIEWSASRQRAARAVEVDDEAPAPHRRAMSTYTSQPTGFSPRNHQTMRLWQP